MRSARVRLPGHPDQACDLVAESIVDEYLRRDPEARIRLSVSGGRGALFVSGDVKSTADFDVSAVVRRALGSCGVMAEMEPFISLDPVTADHASVFQHGSPAPVSVFGYATSETPGMIPTTVMLAHAVGKALDDQRQTNDKMFWLGPDADVFVHANATEPTMVSVQVEHGIEGIDRVRSALTQLVQEIAPGITVRINDLGPCEARGLARVMGASGKLSSPYGSAMPAMPSYAGLDPRQAEKGGSWLLRSAARSLVARGARAAFVQATYMPGEQLPVHVSARDERGKDISDGIPRETLSLRRVMQEWWRPNLATDASRWGFAGDPGFPWEA